MKIITEQEAVQMRSTSHLGELRGAHRHNLPSEVLQDVDRQLQPYDLEIVMIKSGDACLWFIMSVGETNVTN